MSEFRRCYFVPDVKEASRWALEQKGSSGGAEEKHRLAVQRVYILNNSTSVREKKKKKTHNRVFFLLEFQRLCCSSVRVFV